MPTKVVMPQLGEAVLEGTITRWLKQPGETVEEYEALLEVNTDKVDTEIPSPGSGTVLEILVEEGTTVQAGTLLAWIGEPGEMPGQEQPLSVVDVRQVAAPDRVPVAPADSLSKATVAVGRHAELGFISPLVARIAREHNLDLSLVQGTGQAGRITKPDVLAYLEQHKAVILAVPGDGAGIAKAASAVPPTSAYPPLQLPGDEITPLSVVRRAIAEHMVYSERTSPHVTTVMEVDLSRVIAHRLANKDSFQRDGANLTFTVYFAAAAASALKAYPLVNSSWSEPGIIIHHTVNLGIATSLGEAGLIVPVIKEADGLSLLGLARAVNDLVERARSRQLKPDEVKGGTFTITNHGVTGSLFAAPIINQPQCAILGVGAIQKRVVAVSDAFGNDLIAIRPMVYLSLTFDHRILDGAIADLFLAEVVKSLGEW